jgi:hypothetical protein
MGDPLPQSPNLCVDHPKPKRRGWDFYQGERGSHGLPRTATRPLGWGWRLSQSAAAAAAAAAETAGSSSLQQLGGGRVKLGSGTLEGGGMGEHGNLHTPRA